MLARTLRGIALGTSGALTLALVAPAAAHAQAQTSGTRFGVEAAYANHFNLGVGAFVKFHLTQLNDHPITGRVSFDYFFPSNYFGLSQKYWQASADGLYDIANEKSDIKPYVGAGVEYAYYSLSDVACGVYCTGSNGGIGLNILGGLNFMANSKLMPFVEAKIGFAGSAGAYSGSEFVVRGGIHF